MTSTKMITVICMKRLLHIPSSCCWPPFCCHDYHADVDDSDVCHQCDAVDDDDDDDADEIYGLGLWMTSCCYPECLCYLNCLCFFHSSPFLLRCVWCWRRRFCRGGRCCSVRRHSCWMKLTWKASSSCNISPYMANTVCQQL